MADSTRQKSRRKRKPPKPRPDFPLFPHDAGYWAKKVRGKLEYFGRWDQDPKGTAALEQWLKHKDNLLAGRKRRDGTDGLTVEDLCDHFLNAKRPLIASGELTKRTFDDYFATGQRMVRVFGLRRIVDDLGPDDFETMRKDIAKQWGPVRLGNEIQRIRSVFKYGFEAGHIEKPVRFGPIFKRPSKKVLRRNRASKGARMFEVVACRTLIYAAGIPLRAMILLALNGGLGNSDIGNLPLSAINLKSGWVDYPRPKTGVERRFPLWPETIEAITAAIESRPKPKATADSQLVFITKYGDSWAKDDRDSPITKEFSKLLKAGNLHRPGLGFYALRHTFATIAGESRDQVAVDHVMGHSRDDMASVYRERIGDDRLREVTDHVYRWLFPRPTVLAEGGAK